MRLTLLAPLMFVVAGSAFATDLATELQRCQGIADNQARLQCFEQVSKSSQPATPAQPAQVATPAIPAAVSQPATVAVPAASTIKVTPVQVGEQTNSAAASDEDLFGKPIRKIEEAAVNKIVLVVKTAKLDRTKRFEIEMTNGQKWIQTEYGYMDVKAGDKVYIEKAALGSYLLSNGKANKTLRVKRVE
jgi:hypothetical protein